MYDNVQYYLNGNGIEIGLIADVSNCLFLWEHYLVGTLIWTVITYQKGNAYFPEVSQLQSATTAIFFVEANPFLD